MLPSTSDRNHSAKPDGRQVSDEMIAKELGDHQAENSPGFQIVVSHSQALKMLHGPTLDVGCGVGFVVGHLADPMYQFDPFGVDVNQGAITRARQRLPFIPNANTRLQVIQNQTLPFEDEFFSLVTCFDVFDHLEVDQIDVTLAEIERVLRPGGLFIGSASCCRAGAVDEFGNNLHRTVRSPDWWIERTQPDRAEYDGARKQITLWKRANVNSASLFPAAHEVGSLFSSDDDGSEPLNSTNQANQAIGTRDATELSESPSRFESIPISISTPAPTETGNSAELYQRIYEQHEWYGNADEDRCVGVQLIPDYREWIRGRVLDLGCGRGHAVQQLRELGLEADGIDQIRIHPEMQVGDISQPLHDIERYQSVTCIDCIAHLEEEQLLGLFENMKRVERQAFSIHNGPSDETGQELHVNRMEFSDWHRLISQHFDIAAAIKIHDQQMLYLTKRKNGPV